MILWFIMIRVLLKSLMVLFLLFLLIWVIFVYPRDSRVTFSQDIDMRVPQAPEKILYAAFQETSSSQHSMDVVAYKHFLDKALKKTEFKTILSSNRFASDYQFYISSGFYPERLQGFDAVALPHLGSFMMKPLLTLTPSAHLVTQVLAPSGPASLSLKIDGTVITTQKVKQMPIPINTQSFFYRYFLRYFSINYPADVSGWQKLEFELPALKPSSTLTMSCGGEDPASICILSEPLISQTSTQNPAPNIIVILLDTLRQDGLTRKYMPELDTLREISHDYKNALSPGNMTGPSSNALLSCQRPSHIENVAFSYAISSKDREAFYQAMQPSFTWKLRHNGYYTAMLGNISLISEVYNIGVNHGFYENISIEQEAYDTPKIARETLRWLKENGNKQFFLYIHLDGGHAPYRPPLRYFSHNDLKQLKPFSMPSLLKYLYNGELSYTDFYLGKILTGLKQNGLFDSSHIIITSDHADQQTAHLFSHNIAGKIHSGAYFDHGATLLNDEIHVPLIIKPAYSKKHQIHEEYVSNIAIGPTILDWADIAIPEYCEASSLIGAEPPPLNQSIEKENIIGFEGFRMRGILFDQRYKYIRSYETTEKRMYSDDTLSHERSFVLVPEQLFDLQQDPNENHNLIEENIRLKQAARQKFADYYGFSDKYKITIHPKKSSDLSLTFTEGRAPKIQAPPTLKLKTEGTQVTLFGNISDRTEIFVDHLSQWPKILINETRVGEFATRDQLPIKNLAALPAEINKYDDLTSSYNSHDATIIVRHLYFDNMKARAIKSGNMEFEQVLRQWGYLQDDQN